MERSALLAASGLGDLGDEPLAPSRVPLTAGTTLQNPAILNMQGTLTYAAGSNDFSGSVSSSGLNGNAKGRFYGPAANEAGGTFALTGSGVQAYIGAFGAK